MAGQLTIISGGQTGADRAALDFAIQHGFPHDGWCPCGRLAEDGRIPEIYQLEETPSQRYAERTEWNVRDADATVVFTISADVQGGSALTLAMARKHVKPLLHLTRDGGTEPPVAGAAAELRAFLEAHGVGRLNVAGPRGSQEPAVARFVNDVLVAALLS